MKKSTTSLTTKIKNALNLQTLFPYMLIFFGLVGVFASSSLIIKKIDLLEKPNELLACDLNPVYSCSNVLGSAQSEVFGFPNELLGIPVFSAIITLGVFVLAGIKIKPWIWKLYLAGMAGFMLFVFWFFYQSVYVINSLCIYCSMVWFSIWTLTVSGYVWVYDNKILKFSGWQAKVAKVKREYAWLIWFLLIVLFITLILNHFWYYYGSRFGF